VPSPTEVCSVQFNVAAGVTSSHTTTAFARTFSKTVETEDEEEEDAKHRHLSECSFTVGGRSSGTLARVGVLHVAYKSGFSV
jgi:hypothetical protein